MDTKIANLTPEQKKKFDQARDCIDKFCGFDEVQKAYCVQEMTKKLGVEAARKWLGKLCDFDKLLNTTGFSVTLVVPVPEPSSEFPTAPVTEPAKIAIGPFNV